MATITVFLRKVNTRHLEQPLNVRFRHGAAGKCELVLSTGYQVPPTELKNGRVTGTGAKEINDLLHNMQSDLEQAFKNLEQRQGPVLKPAMQAEYLTVKAAREANEKRQRQEVQQADTEAGDQAIASKMEEGHLQERIQQLQRKLERQREQTTVKAATWKVTSQRANLPDLTDELTNVMVETGLISPAPTSADLLVSYIAKYNARGKNKLSDSTIRIYNSIANLLNRYNPTLRIQEVNRDTLQDLEDFMVREGQLNQTIEAYMGKVTAILNYYGPDLELSQSYKRYKFDLTIAKNDVTFLHPRQLRDLMEYKKPHEINPNQPNRKTGKAYDRVVDILLMLVSTGLRYSDIFSDFRQLIKSETGYDGKQRAYIHITPQKTKRKQIRCKIPVTKLMKGILERNNYQLRKMEDYYFNQLLREYCQGIASFQQEVTSVAFSGKEEKVSHDKLCDVISSHIGRKTNISYLFALDVPAPEIIGRSGHTDYSTLMLYAQKLDDIKTEVQALNFFALPD